MAAIERSKKTQFLARKVPGRIADLQTFVFGINVYVKIPNSNWKKVSVLVWKCLKFVGEEKAFKISFSSRGKTFSSEFQREYRRTRNQKSHKSSFCLFQNLSSYFLPLLSNNIFFGNTNLLISYDSRQKWERKFCKKKQ